MTEEKPSAKLKVRTWAKAQIDGKTEVKAPDVAAAALDAFKADTDLLTELGGELLYSMVYNIVLSAIGETRARDHGPTITMEQLAQKRDELTVRFTKWKEHIGESHKSLLRMTGREIDVALAEHQARYDAEAESIAFLTALRKRVKDTQEVGKVLTVEQIEFIRMSCANKKEQAA